MVWLAVLITLAAVAVVLTVEVGIRRTLAWSIRYSWLAVLAHVIYVSYNWPKHYVAPVGWWFEKIGIAAAVVVGMLLLRNVVKRLEEPIGFNMADVFDGVAQGWRRLKKSTSERFQPVREEREREAS